MTTTVDILLAMFISYSVHCAGEACEALLGDDPSETCRRCCRIARWVSVIALAAIAGVYGAEAFANRE